MGNRSLASTWRLDIIYSSSLVDFRSRGYGESVESDKPVKTERKG